MQCSAKKILENVFHSVSVFPSLDSKRSQLPSFYKYAIKETKLGECIHWILITAIKLSEMSHIARLWGW